jgi:hypothetical protein
VTRPTPGYNCRLTIWFTTPAKGGRRRAWYWSFGATRAIPLRLADAELFIAQDQADQTCCHPLRPHSCGKEN